MLIALGQFSGVFIDPESETVSYLKFDADEWGIGFHVEGVMPFNEIPYLAGGI